MPATGILGGWRGGFEKVVGEKDVCGINLWVALCTKDRTWVEVGARSLAAERAAWRKLTVPYIRAAGVVSHSPLNKPLRVCFGHSTRLLQNQ